MPLNSDRPINVSDHLQHAIQDSMCDYQTISNRNNGLDVQLKAIGLSTIDVGGDGNCLFRAVSRSIYGNEDSHMLLRKQAVNWIRSNGNPLSKLMGQSPDDGSTFADHLKRLGTCGQSVGEDAIIALSNVCKRTIIVHVANTAPLVYKPLMTAGLADVVVAFYEPGHYKTVLDFISTKSHINF